MPTVATYYQLADDEFSLAVGDNRMLTQSVADAPAGGEGALVTWMARRRGRRPNTAGTVTYTVTLNGNPLGTGPYSRSSAEPITIQEATPIGAVNQGTNRLVFTVTDGTGALRLSAVVLWVRLNV
jgi:hypothetical protein